MYEDWIDFVEELKMHLNVRGCNPPKEKQPGILSSEPMNPKNKECVPDQSVSDLEG